MVESTSHVQERRYLDDPTELTVKLVMRELMNLREVMEARMDGSDKIQGLHEKGLDGRKEAIVSEVKHLHTLHGEKFDAIQMQFKERDVRTEQAAGAVKIAVDAALQAQKEAVGEQNKSSALAITKSETATLKQIEQIGTTIQNLSVSLSDKIDDVKARLQRSEGQTLGGKDVKEDHKSNIAIGISVVMAVITIITLVFTLTRNEPRSEQVVLYPTAAAVAQPQTVPSTAVVIKR